MLRAAIALGILGMFAACGETTDEPAAEEGVEAEADPSESLEGAEFLFAITAPKTALTGMYRWDAPYGPALVDAAGAWTGRSQQMGLAFSPRQSWQALYDLRWQTAAWSKWVKAQAGRRLVYSLGMLPGPTDGSGPDGKRGTADDVSLASCAKGAYDKHFATVAAQLIDAGLSGTVIRLGWEWDGDWFPWSARGKEALFAQCFRKAVDAMRAARPYGDLAFEWSASDDIFWWPASKVDQAYPGDNYVDVFGVNAYDVSWVPNSYPIPTNCTGSCASKRRLTAWNDMMRGVYLMRDRAIARKKLLSIPEWGLWHRADGHGGGDNVEYIERMRAFVTNPNNRVFYQIYFDVDWTDGGHQISPVAGTGATGFKGTTYKTKFPSAAARYRTLFGATK